MTYSNNNNQGGLSFLQSLLFNLLWQNLLGLYNWSG